MKNLIIMIPIICSMFFGACAGRQPCPSESAEPISVCRAEAACGKGSAGNFFGTLLSGAGSGLSRQRNQAVDNYDLCVQRELAAQSYNAQLQK